MLKQNGEGLGTFTSYRKLWSTEVIQQYLIFEFYIDRGCIEGDVAFAADLKEGFKQSVLMLWKGGDYPDRKSLLTAWEGERGERLRLAGLASLTSGLGRCKQLMSGAVKPTNLIEMALYRLTDQWSEEDQIFYSQHFREPTPEEVASTVKAGKNPCKIQLFEMSRFWKNLESKQTVEPVSADVARNSQTSPESEEQPNCEIQRERASSPDSHVLPAVEKHGSTVQDSSKIEPEPSQISRLEFNNRLIVGDGSPNTDSESKVSKPPLQVRTREEKKKKNIRDREVRRRRASKMLASLSSMVQKMSMGTTRSHKDCKE